MTINIMALRAVRREWYSNKTLYMVVETVAAADNTVSAQTHCSFYARHDNNKCELIDKYGGILKL